MATDGGGAREETANFNSNFPVKTQRVEAEQADHTPKVSAVEKPLKMRISCSLVFVYNFKISKQNTNKITGDILRQKNFFFLGSATGRNFFSTGF
jgi:hypothetical protein